LPGRVREQQGQDRGREELPGARRGGRHPQRAQGGATARGRRSHRRRRARGLEPQALAAARRGGGEVPREQGRRGRPPPGQALPPTQRPRGGRKHPRARPPPLPPPPTPPPPPPPPPRAPPAPAPPPPAPPPPPRPGPRRTAEEVIDDRGEGALRLPRGLRLLL